MEYYAFELLVAAKKLLEEVMLTKPGEEVVITVDTAGDWQVALTTAQAAYALGATPTIVFYQTQPESKMEPPAPVAGAILKADVWVEYATQYIDYTETRFKATNEVGTRYGVMCGMTPDLLIRAIGQVDYPKLIAMGEELIKLTKEAEEIHITSQEGTDLVGRLGDLVVQRGIAKGKGGIAVLGGQVSHYPSVETIEGKIVVDGVIWPPREIGTVKEPVELVIEEGFIKEVNGGLEADIFERWLESKNDPKMYRLAHYSYGFNPAVSRPTGRIVEDERVFGSHIFGFGTTQWEQAASHTDVIILRPSIYLDGVEIERDGKFVHPSLVPLCEELEAPGY